MNFVDEIGVLFHGTVRRISREATERTGRALNQLRALRAIEAGGIHTQCELAERLRIDAAATSRLVDRLEEEGLLQRLKGNDRRSIRLEVTRKAEPEIAAIKATTERMDAELRSYLTAGEVLAFERILARLNGALARAAAEREE